MEAYVNSLVSILEKNISDAKNNIISFVGTDNDRAVISKTQLDTLERTRAEVLNLFRRMREDA